MESRQEQLSQLRNYIKEVDNEITMILQSLQWDRDTLLQANSMVTCKYDTNHRIPEKKLKEHEEKCYLKGYKPDELLPEPLDPNAKTLVKFSSDEIKQIIDRASTNDPLFKRGNGGIISEPLTLGQIAATYTTDERRAIHDAVVNTMPLFHDLSDLALPSSSCNPVEGRQKSRLEVLAELRDVRRRRARYRSSAPAKNYSHTLRELIATQMEIYTGSNTEVKDEQSDQNVKDTRVHEDTQSRDKEKYTKGSMRENVQDRRHYVRDDRDRHNEREDRYGKRERERSSYSKDRSYYRHDDSKIRSKYDDSNRYERSSTFKDRRERDSERDKYRERTEARYRKSEKNEYRRYYDCDYRNEKLERHSSKEKSRHREYK